MPETAALISVEEYLSTNYKPACDYIDGALRQKSMPTKKHSLVQFFVGLLIFRDYRMYALPELTVKVRAGKYLVPDLAVVERGSGGDPYPTEPVYLCVEILSPGDRMSKTLAKCEEYHAWGVEYTWVLDPMTQRAWEYHKGCKPVETGDLITAGVISLRCAEVFSDGEI